MTEILVGERLARILIIDDDAPDRRSLGEAFRHRAMVQKMGVPSEALQWLQTNIVDVILLEYDMVEMDGLKVLKCLQEDEQLRQIPVILLADDSRSELHATEEGIACGAADFLRKPFLASVARLRVRRVLQFDYLQRHLKDEVQRQTALAEKRRADSEKMFQEMVLALAKTIDAKDAYTMGHSQRVAAYAREIARRSGEGRQRQDEIYQMGLLHDIGKIGVPQEIINKVARLTEEEYKIIKSHTTVGAKILEMITSFPILCQGAWSHHERYDGRGYPAGLAGDDIPIPARIIAVADSYDAMTSTRSYRGRMSQAAVREEIARGRGTQFDPVYADIMLQMMDEDTAYEMHD